MDLKKPNEFNSTSIESWVQKNFERSFFSTGEGDCFMGNGACLQNEAALRNDPNYHDSFRCKVIGKFSTGGAVALQHFPSMGRKKD